MMLIEKYQTEIKLSKREKDSLTSWNKVRKPWITLCSCFEEHVCASYKFSNETKKINERLDEIKKDWDMVGLLKTTPKVGGEDPAHGEHDNPRETTHHMGIQPPIGRENDKKEIVKKLLSNDSTESSKTQKGGVSIISIIGKGEIGKTTLAKMVFKESEEHFGKRRWWVCVSERLNRKDLVRQILREVSGENPDCSLNELCTQLQNELSKKKFLLVLDDVWEVKWWEEEIKGTLMAGAVGSNIMITSRKKDVSEGMCASYVHQLQEFSFDQSWELFLKEALREGQTEEDLVMHKIKDVGKRIVEKCGGLPLVIKTVGSMMRNKGMSKEDWEFVEDSNIWEWEMPAASSSSTEIGGNILPGLMLSYDDLPYYLKNCFVYCCIYPKDYEIERKILIRQWVAHGLIEEKKGMDVEVIANQYINDLIRRCLIEKTLSRNMDETLKLHDILHDLALYIGRGEYSHTFATEQTRHLSLLGVHDAKAHKHNALETTNKVRTLLADSNSYLQVYIEQLTNFNWLRVLSLRRCQNIQEFPNSFECLSLLKYLDLCSSDVRQLPSSIGRLCNLQILDLSYSEIEELPKEMGELCNLRYLGLEGTTSLTFIAEGLGKLTNLRILNRFMVCNDKGKRRGCNIRELKDLNKLKGELSIEGLGRSRKAIDHVGNSRLLKEKHGIISLELDFGITGGGDEQSGASEQSGVLEALEPPLGLECLKIYHYKGQKMPAWHFKTKYTMLQTLHIIKCPALYEIGSMPALESLEVSWCSSLEQLPHHMPALESLKLFGSNSLKALVDMPALESLQVTSCDSLEQLPHHMPALELLEVSWCGSLEQLPHDLPALKLLKVKGCDRLNTLANMPALESLEVSWCGNLEQLPHHMPALESLKVEYCGSLEKLPHDMPALERLEVKDCGSLDLKQLPHDMPALESLEVYGCNWEGWPTGGLGETTFTSMSCLRWVYFENCPNMQTQGLIYVLSKQAGGDSRVSLLQTLSMWNCPSAGLGWKLLEQLPNLIELKLDSESALLLPSPLPSQISTFLPSLKTLELRDNTNIDEKVKWGRLPQWVWGLSQLEDLSLYSFSEDISLGGHWQCLPNLRYLELYFFPNLKSLVDITTHQNENDSEATTCPMDASEQIACLSKLQSLRIHSCPALNLPQELRDHLGLRLSIRSY